METVKEKRSAKEYLLRYAVFLLGLFVSSQGIALSAIAGLGTSPVSSIPYSLSLLLPKLSFGSWLNVMALVQISIQAILQRKNSRPLEIGVQLIVAFTAGYLTDLSLYLLRFVQPSAYLERLACMLVSCVVTGLGISIQFRAGVAMLPGEAMNRAISQVTGKRYENLKIFFDVFYIIGAVVICLVFLGGLRGVREGSVIAALAIGNVIKLFNRLFDAVQRRFSRRKES